MTSISRIIIYIFLILASHPNLQAQSEKPIVVQLDSEAHLLPLYLVSIKNDKSAFDNTYLDQLTRVLRFDLNYNGMTKVLPQDSKKETWASSGSFDEFGSVSQWKSANTAYVVKAKVTDKKLIVKALSTFTQSVKSVSDVTLTGDLSQDRRQIHALSDAMFKSLFGKVGVASTHILYSVKSQGANPKNWNSEIFECDYDGGNPRRITRNAGYCITPCYIPPKSGNVAGNYFYVSYQNGQPKIYISSLKRSKATDFQLYAAISLCLQCHIKEIKWLS